MPLSFKISGVYYSVLEGSLTLEDTIDLRSTAEFYVLDPTGSVNFTVGEEVEINDTILGRLFRGYVSDPKAQNYTPQVTNWIDVICADNTYLADRAFAKKDYVGRAAGDIVADLVTNYLAQDGVNGASAIRTDSTVTQFNLGLLNNTIGVANIGDGNLELAPGLVLTISESTNADFSTGTLTNMQAMNDTLIPTTINALKMQSTLSYAYGTEFAQAERSVSGTAYGTASGTASGSISGTASGSISGSANGTASSSVYSSGSYTPSGYVSISGGTGGESASFSGSGGSINVNGSFSTGVSSSISGSGNFPFSTSGSFPFSTGVSSPFSSIIHNAYQPRQKSTVTIGNKTYPIVTVDAAVADNRADAMIWTGSQVIGTNDTLNYDIWISSTSPSCAGGIDLFFNDGTILTQYLGTLDVNFDIGIWDQNFVSISPIQDLTNYAKDTWYTRNINLSIIAGKTVIGVSFFNASNVAGDFLHYVKNCYLGSHSGTPFFGVSQTAPSLNPPVLSSIGAFITAGTLVKTCAVYRPEASSRISPAHSIDAIKLVKSSIISWTTTIPAIGPGVIAGSVGSTATAGQEALFVSYDATTWLPCVNNQPLPGLPTGANCAGMSLYLKETFSAGPDPTALPLLLDVNITMLSAAHATTSDIVASYGTTTAWNTGTMLGLAPNSLGDLALGLTSYSWTNLGNMTFVPGGNAISTLSVSGGALIVNTPTLVVAPPPDDDDDDDDDDCPHGSHDSNAPPTDYVSWSSTRFNFIAAVQDFTVEADFTLNASSPSQNEIGFVYRQTYWGAPNNSFAYYIRILQAAGSLAGGTSISLGYGVNSPPGKNTVAPPVGNYVNIAQSAKTITNNTTYHVKIVVSGNRHIVYWNRSTTPSIDMLDNTYLGAGNVGLRTFLSSANTSTNKIANFTITNTYAGIWTSPAINLSGICGNTQVSWSEVDMGGDEQTNATVLASLDSGATWQECTNGSLLPTASIPGLAPGTNTTGQTLRIQIILSSIAPVDNSIIQGLYVRVCGAYPGSTGTRISPITTFGAVPVAGSTLISWNGLAPTNTTIGMESSIDNGITWTSIGSGASGSASIPGIAVQLDPSDDTFNTDSSLQYIATHRTGGTISTNVWNVSQSRLEMTGGINALLVSSPVSAQNVDITADTDRSDAGGFCWRWTTASNYYALDIFDDTSNMGATNAIKLYKVVSNNRTQIGANIPITFTRGQPYRIRVTMVVSLITVYFDGAIIATATDTSLTVPGLVGLSNVGGSSQFYQLRLQPLGQSTSGVVALTRATLYTSDPGVSPQITDITVSCRSPNIQTGAIIPITQYNVLANSQNTIAQDFDDLCKQSGNFIWYIDNQLDLYFQQRTAVISPWILTGNDICITGSPTLETIADLYRNDQFITNGIDVLPINDKFFVSDGTIQTWVMDYPVDSIIAIKINGNPVTLIGILGVDTGKQFYYTKGDPTISLDPSLSVEGLLSFSYNAQKAITVEIRNDDAIALRAGYDNTSGIVQSMEDGNGITKFAMIQKAAGLLEQYSVVGRTIVFDTMRPGLVSGQLLTIFLPQIGIYDDPFLITDVSNVPFTSMTNNIETTTPFATVTATEGPVVGDWTRFFGDLWKR